MYFIGVSTAKSMIMRVFPEWAKHLGFGDCEIRGIDLALHDRPERYREVVAFIKADPFSQGALVTTHKIDLLRASRDMFDELDEFGSLMGEVSSISKSGGRLVGAAKDPVTSGHALEAFLSPDHWARTGGDAFLIGAGGSSIALSSYVLREDHGFGRPRRLFISNRSPARLQEMRAIHKSMAIQFPVEYIHTPTPRDNDAVLTRLSEGSLVVNATGLGKDAPGSPLTGEAPFPKGAIAWDFNYRGDLVFLQQAKHQAAARSLRVEDGWLYFVYGWLSVIGDVFHREIPARGPLFDELCSIAARQRNRKEG
jgi:shikimate 5-dehydrogenase